MNKVKVTTEKQSNGWWRVRVMESDVVDSTCDIVICSGLFSSRKLAREYIREYKNRFAGKYDVVGGLH